MDKDILYRFEFGISNSTTMDSLSEIYVKNNSKQTHYNDLSIVIVY